VGKRERHPVDVSSERADVPRGILGLEADASEASVLEQL
jgi:hypothetical protein